ncbi:hypothetical protein [Streptomyces sp. NPDC101776]|uniref:hypothetical protein n=1 Tax=Streptomyces sp. NPDC101776 TaxID=3366146 RepID=UPI0037FA7CC9
MSADRETNQTMTDRDIALLLADAADEVEIGIAPYQAVIRGGRRRRARRWALATATALVIAGTSGTLALAGLRDGNGVEVSPAVTQKSTAPSTQERHVYAPQETMLATGTEKGEEWYISVDVWGAPRTEGEAQAQLQAMAGRDEQPWDKDQASALVGKTTYFVRRTFGSEAPSLLMGDSASRQDTMAGEDLKSGASTLDPNKTDGPQRLVVGHVAKTARAVTCTWKDGSSTVARRVAAGADVNSDEATIRPAAGSPDNWFVCVAPEGKSFDSVKVTE